MGVWAVAYAALVAVGPQGLIPNPVWPVISQHVLQTRAWLGDDIDLLNEDGTFDRTDRRFLHDSTSRPTFNTA